MITFFGIVISIWTIAVIYVVVRLEREWAKQRRARKSLQDLILELKRKWQEKE